MTRTKFSTEEKPVRRRAKTGPKPVYIGRLHEVYCFALLGATERELARLFDVHPKTVEYWSRHYADFREARDRGAAEADAKVAQRMYQRAIGYSYDEKEFKMVPVADEKGELIGYEERLVRRTTKHVPADVKAGFKWLSNRQRDKWTEAGYIHMRHTHEGQINHLHREVEELDLDALSEQARDLLFELNMQQLEQGKRTN